MKLRNLLKGTPARPPVTVAPDPQCTKTTSKGTRCKNPAAKGSDRCVLPAHQKM